MKAFLDTIAFKAFLNRTHPKHFSTVETFQELARLKFKLFTSTQVLSETHEYLLNHLSPSIAKEFIKILKGSSITILRPTPKDQYISFKLLNQPSTLNLPFKDAVHIAMMHRKRISKALSSSPHFPRYNLTLIRA